MFNGELTAKVALEAIKNYPTMTQVIQHCQANPITTSGYEVEMIEHAADIFTRSPAKDESGKH